MPHNRISIFGLILVALALGALAPAAPDAEAAGGPIIPIFDDEIVSIATDGIHTIVAPAFRYEEMTQVYGSATLDTLGSAIANAPPAASGSLFVMHGCEAAGDAVGQLAGRGYDSASTSPSSFPDTSIDTVYAD